MNTYRYHGHSMSDPGITYRSRDEISGIRKTRDPIEYVKNLLIENEFATADDLKKEEKEMRARISEEVEKARESPNPNSKVSLLTF